MQQKYALVAASIMMIWLAVLFVGVFGPGIKDEHSVAGVRTQDEVPAIVIAAPSAMIATIALGWFGFRQ